MSFRLALLIVTRAVVEMFAIPLDPKAAQDVRSYLNAAGNVDTAQLFRIARLPIRVFAQVVPGQQFDAVKTALWQDIRDRASKDIAEPDFWTEDTMLFDVAEYLKDN